MGAMKKVASQMGVVKGSEEDEAAKNRCVAHARRRPTRQHPGAGGAALPQPKSSLRP